MDNETFFKMPKVLFTDKYKDLSAEAKLLYGLMLIECSYQQSMVGVINTERSLSFIPLPKQVKCLVVVMTKQQGCSVSL